MDSLGKWILYFSVVAILLTASLIVDAKVNILEKELVNIQQENIILREELDLLIMSKELKEMEMTGIQVDGDPAPTKYIMPYEDFKLVEQIVAGEARGQSELCCKLVAESIRDRMIVRKQSLQDVIFAKAQYCDPYVGDLDPKTAEKIRKAVYAVFYDDWKYDDRYYILHFHDTSVTPYWASDFTKVVQEGAMIFYT